MQEAANHIFMPTFRSWDFSTVSGGSTVGLPGPAVRLQASEQTTGQDATSAGDNHQGSVTLSTMLWSTCVVSSDAR